MKLVENYADNISKIRVYYRSTTNLYLAFIVRNLIRILKVIKKFSIIKIK